MADRFIQVCGGLSEREMSEQVLDSMDIERERGITIKAQSVTLDYTAKMVRLTISELYRYAWSRGLSCRGFPVSFLLREHCWWDAAQGVEGSICRHRLHGHRAGLEVVPILNKMDLPQAEPDRVKVEIEDIIGIDARDAVPCSAKVVSVLTKYWKKSLKIPRGRCFLDLQALIIDSWFDNYLGVVSLVQVKHGTLKKVKNTHQVNRLGRAS